MVTMRAMVPVRSPLGARGRGAIYAHLRTGVLLIAGSRDAHPPEARRVWDEALREYRDTFSE
jgi:hypothetical protein